MQSENFVLDIFFGKNIEKHYKTLCQKFYMLFPMPIFQIYFEYAKSKKLWMIKKIEPLLFSDIQETQIEFLKETTYQYFTKKRQYSPRKKAIYFDLAILHNSEEDHTAPSNKEALKRFIEAGNELGIHSELIEKKDYKTLSEYDGLFIRETTAVNHYTYSFSRRAMAERLVVIDDPNSILKCANKVYLAELLNKHRIATPQTFIVSRENYKEKRPQITFPCILKSPDSSCSKGVKKAHDAEEMINILKEFFKKSELILVQFFMPTEFDWRIAIIDNAPLFACRYFMAEGHWQIFNWEEKILKNQEGHIDAVPLHQVPPLVLDKAIKATKLIGDGLYGVDLKEIGKKVYVIEVNDNPSIDHGAEDKLLKDALYIRIMQVFLERMKKQRGYR